MKTRSQAFACTCNLYRYNAAREVAAALTASRLKIPGWSSRDAADWRAPSVFQARWMGTKGTWVVVPKEKWAELIRRHSGVEGGDADDNDSDNNSGVGGGGGCGGGWETFAPQQQRSLPQPTNQPGSSGGRPRGRRALNPDDVKLVCRDSQVGLGCHLLYSRYCVQSNHGSIDDTQ